MLGLYVSVPVACFRKGFAREYLETEALPPPATCYGFLLSLVGEVDRDRHIGCRISPGLLSQPEKSVVLRTVWRIKKRQDPLGHAGNRTPAQQELLTDVRLVVWLDSLEEVGQQPTLEGRVADACLDPERITRFGGLSLGESTHLVDEVKLIRNDRVSTDVRGGSSLFVVAEFGQFTLPVWVDHVGSEGTRYVVGELKQAPLAPPDRLLMPKIEPP